MINRENLIKTGRAGGNTSNQETPDQIGRVGMSAVETSEKVEHMFLKVSAATLFTVMVGRLQ